MSADNGVYIAKFPDGFRVTHAQAIENVDYYKPGTLQRKIELRRYFGKSEVYQTRDDAAKKGWSIADEVTKDGSPLEYGISFIGEFEEFQSSGNQEICWRCDKIYIPKEENTSSCEECVGQNMRVNK